MPSRRSGLLVAGLLLAGAAPAVATAPAAAALTANEVYPVPASGSFVVDGHGWGHGHGLSQTGAQGAASLGKTSEQITSFYYPGTTRQVLASSAIRVLISADNDADTQVYPASNLAVTDLATGASATLPSGPTRWRALTGANGLSVQYYSGAWKPFAVGGKTVVTGPVQFSGPSVVRLALPDGTSRDYRGAMRSVRTSATAVQSVNVPSMESYLAGVVPRESSSSWKAAALEAQAIAARTYAAENRSRYATTRSYDICDTTQCQVYGGQAVYTASGTKTTLEASSTNAAVTATNGVIRTYEGKPIFAQFSASNGGWSTDGGTPYLVAQEDPYDGAVASTIHSWSATLTAQQVQARFPAVGTLKTIVVTSRDGNGEWGGRVKTVTLQGVDSQGQATSVTTTGAGIYNAHSWPAYSDGLRSSWWHPRPSTDSAVVSQSAAPTLVQSPGASTGTLTVTMRNTGTVAWSTSGLHLALASPAGDPDPLAGNTRSPGRYTGSASSIAPNETAAFSFSLTGDNVPVGVQSRSYRLAIGGGKLFGATVSWKVPVVAPVFTAAVASKPTATDARPAGAPADQPDAVSADGRNVVVPVKGSTGVRFSLKNTGNVTWPTPAVRLGAADPRASTAAAPSAGETWITNRRPGPVTAATSPSATGTFDVRLYGNGRPLGVTREVFEPLWESEHWLDGALTSLYVIRVDPSLPKASTLENAPTSLSLTNAPNGTASVRVRLRNVGAQAWTVGSETLSSTATPLSTSAWPSSTTPPPLSANPSRPGAAKVYPGEVGEWLVPLSAYKKAAGTYRLTLRPAGVGPALPLTVTVSTAVLSGKVTRVAPSVDVPRAGSATTFFEVKNTGNVAWPVGGDFRSISLRSGGSPSRSSAWISATRPSAVTSNATSPGATSVLPGQVARFSFVLAGNDRAPQSTSEPFGLIWEGWQRVSGLTATLAYRVV